ncbi:hypothetical protein MA16_Dca019051 [Dendrobium catenatum]|uniref:Uncharacterized protein n=1 Tax=Dendrobium catenatum TaxID=906689 RepID=A0A2I0W285_9ASPA|nr:hypothetical protein MA16_Dca019051 [Dendrobium catenatum]
MGMLWSWSSLRIESVRAGDRKEIRTGPVRRREVTGCGSHLRWRYANCQEEIGQWVFCDLETSRANGECEGGSDGLCMRMGDGACELEEMERLFVWGRSHAN